MKKYSILISMMLMLLAGFTSCDDEKAMPPIIIPEGGLGTGAWNDPYTATQILGGTQGNGKWVTAYIVGWINTFGGTNNTMSAETCTFTAQATLSSNILLAADPAETNWENCIPVQLTTGDVRTALNLQDNPGNLGKQVTVKANVERYFGKNEALKSVTAYNWGAVGIDDGNGGGNNNGGGGTVTGTEIYSGLVNNADDWKFDVINMPSGLSYIWQWSVYNNSGYLNGSAYANGKANAAEAYAISPVIDLSGCKEAAVTFDHAAKFQTTLKTLCGLAVRESGSTAWTMLTIPTWPEEGSWNFVPAGSIDLTAYAGKKIELAFKYGSSASGADTWEIKNFKVTGNK